MSFKLLNRARMSVLGAPGTGALALNLATTGFRDFVSAGMADGDTTSYLIEDGSPIGTAWEIGVGTYHSNGTLTRDTVTASSAGGTTKISVTSSAIISAIVRAEDLMADAGVPGSTAPVVVQHTYTTSTDTNGLGSLTLGAAPTPGNLLVAMGACSATDGFEGFNCPWADNQYHENSTTAYEVGYAFRVVQSGDGATYSVGQHGSAPYGGMLTVILLEISGANLSLLTEAHGSLASSSGSIQASNPAQALSIFLAVGDGAANPSISAPSSFQVSEYYTGNFSMKAGWNTITGAGNAGVTGSVASGTTKVQVLNLPGA